MNRSISLYLDLVRIVAAWIVFIGHATGALGGFLWQLSPYQHEAVTVFFVLSGFVVAYATDRPGVTARAYVIARAARIYSVVVPALIITWIMDGVGRLGNPAIYMVDEGASWHFLTQMLFINAPWGHLFIPGSNGPFWTLNYEVWFYVAFGAFLFAPRRWRWSAAGGALLLTGPSTVMLASFWLAGVGAYHARRIRLGAAASWLLCCVPLLVWAAYEVHALGGGRWLNAPTTGRLMLYQDILVTGCFALHLVGFGALTDRGWFAAWPERTACAVRWLAGASFTFYLLHLPVMRCMSAWMPLPHDSWVSRILILTLVPCAMLALAELGERRKDAWRAAFTRMWDNAARFLALGRATP